ncbi:MAG: TIM barrel protein [Dehalococcoidia bacterium]|nr:TIM barrel protein [Dehalococcoidia bacterium]
MTRYLLFGPGGVPNSSPQKTTTAGVARVAELGLGCMEVEFVQGVRMTPGGAREVGMVAVSAKVALSAHGPYYINLNAREPEKVEASRQRILQTARVARMFGGRSAVFHAAFMFNDSPDRVFRTVKRELSDLSAILRSEGNDVILRPEVTGKPSQFGTVEELIELAAEIEGVLPGIDFAHLHARTGKCNTYREFVAVLRQVESGLGRQALDNMHLHVSGIEYGRSGEIRHLNLKDPRCDMNYVDLVRAFRDLSVKGLVICESPNLEDDAALLQETYDSLT